MARTKLLVGLEFSSSISDDSEGRGVKRGMRPTRLSPVNAHSWPRRGRSRKEYLCQAWLWPLFQNEKWTIGGHCVSNQLSIIQGQILHSVGPPLLPLSSLQLSALWPVSCPSENHSQSVGRWRKGEGSKIQIHLFIAVPQTLLQKEKTHWLNQHSVYLGF